jgi:2-polyprenyl-3-methyl-5-hydroxy-6-metoxy-1,4-benzoquinol methylase
MSIKIMETGAWDYNNSNHDESDHLDKGLLEFLIYFINNNKIKNIFDFGCSTGYYLNILNKKIKNINLIGVEPEVMLSKNKKFDNILNYDLSKPFQLGTKGSVICLEVIEHIPKEYETVAIDNIINHCEDFLFISWARPGQGGLGHVNEQSLSYVIELFEKRNFIFLEKESLNGRESAFLPWLKTNFCVFKKK